MFQEKYHIVSIIHQVVIGTDMKNVLLIISK